MAPNYRDYLIAQGVLKAAQQQAQQPPSPGLGMGMPTPAYANVMAPRRQMMTDQRRLTAPPVVPQPRPGMAPGNPGAPAPIPYTRWGDTIGSVNARAVTPMPPVPPVADPAAQAAAAAVASLQQRGAGQEASIVSDPLYQRLVYNGASPREAMQLVEQDRASKAAETQRSATQTELAEADGGAGVVDRAFATGSAPLAAAGKKGLDLFARADDWTRLKVQEPLAWTVYGNIKRLRDNGASDQEIIDLLNSDTLMQTYIPSSLWDATPEEQRMFIDGVINAYENGYTAYGREAPLGGVGMGAVAAEPVAEFEPGARAAHEFIAGERSWMQRAVNDLSQSPFNYLFGPLRGAGAKAAEAAAVKAAAAEGTGAAARAAAWRIAQGAGKAAAVPDIVLNKAADNLVNETLEIGKEMIGSPRIGFAGTVGRHLTETPIRVQARAAGEDYLDAVRIADDIEKGGTGAVTDIGGMPPYPDRPLLALPATSTTPYVQSVPGPTSPMGPIPPRGLGIDPMGRPIEQSPVSQSTLLETPALPEKASTPDFVAGPGGQIEDVSTTRPSASSYTGKGVPDVPPSPAEPTMADVPSLSEMSGPRQVRPDLTPEDRIAGIKAGEVNVFDPYENGARLVDDAAAAARTGDPERVASWERFNADNTPKRTKAWEENQRLEAEQKALRDSLDVYDENGKRRYMPQAERDNIFAQIRRVQAEQTINAIEHTVYDVADDYVRYIGDLPDLPITARRVDPKNPNKPGAKASFMDESTAYLAQRYVFTGDTKALDVLVHPKREFPLTAEQAQRLRDARESLADMVDTQTRRANQAALDRERELAVGASQKNVLQRVDAKLSSAKTSGSNSPINKEYRAMRSVATQAKSLDDGVRRLMDYGEGAYDVRADSVTQNFEGMPVYASTTNGRGWKRVDQVIELFKKWWTDAQKTYAVNPQLRRLMRLERTAADAIPTSRPVLRDPSMELPEDVRIKMDETPFEKHERFKDMTFRQVRDTIEREVSRDQKRANSLTSMGYEATPSKKRRDFVPAPGEIRVKVGETPSPKPGGKPKDVIQKRPVAGTWENPGEELWMLQQKYARYGDILTGDVRELANELAARAKEFDIYPELARHPPLALDLIDAVINRLPRHLLLADPLTSWGYTGRNIMGNIETAALGTQGESFGRILESFRTAADETESMAMTVTRDLGLGRVPSQYTKESITAVDIVAKGADTPTRELARKLKLDWLARGFDKKRSLDAAIEYGFKLESAYTPILQGNILEATGDLANEMGAYAGRRSLPINRDEFMDLFMDLRKADSRVFNGDDVYDGVLRLAKSKGMADDAAKAMAQDASRKWKGMARKAQLNAIDQTNRIFPSQRRMTNADRYFSYISIFHFWPTRTAKLVLEEMIRNPQLINLWRDTHSGLERMAEEGNYPLAVKMLMRVAASPFGFMLYANPVSLFLVTALNPERPDVPDPRNITEVGKFLREFQQQTGLGFSPFIDAVLNISGVYGDAFPPNPWPSRTTELAGAVYDAILIQLGHNPGTPVYDNAMAWLRSQGSGIVPGTSNIPYKDQRAYTLDLVGSMVLEMNPDLAVRMQAVDANGNSTPDAIAARNEYDAIMQNQDDPAYVAAEKLVAWQNVMTRGINAWSPLTISARIQGRDQTIESARAGYAARDAGLTATSGQQGASNLRGDATATDDGRTLRIDQAEFNNIGTPRQQSLHNYWTDIVYNLDDQKFDGQVLWIGNTQLSVDSLRALTEDERMEIADQWIASVDGTDDLKGYRDERKAYLAANPEYGSYEADWKGTIRGYEGGVRQFRIDRAAGNPNFKAAVAEKEAQLKKDGVDAALIPDELDSWTYSIAAYKAAQGIKDNIYDPDPLSTGDQPTVNTILRAQSGDGGGSSTKKAPVTIAQKVTKELREYEQEAAMFSDILTGFGIEGGYESINNPLMRPVLEGQFGDLMPSMSTLLRQYMEWKAYMEANYPGSDTSPEAFQRVVESVNQDVAA